eukprot:5676716-Amphidinium_carterae.1
MEVRTALGRAFKTEDIAAVDNGKVKTPIRAGLLEAMVQALRDPGDPITQWLVEGAPAGIATQPVLDK